MIFDPLRMREVSDETLEMIQNTEFDESRPMGNVARMQLEQLIRLWLVGRDVESRHILSKLHAWLEGAISNNEDFGENQKYHLMNLHRAAAVCIWMDSGEDDLKHWSQALHFHQSIEIDEKVYSKKDFSTSRVDKLMGCANLAQQYNFGITEFEKHYSPISDFNKILKPRDFGYASCIYHSRSDLQRDVLFKAGREMLKKNLQESWLGGGQYIEALIWLRLVYQYDESSLSPLQILLKAYENMPDVPRPSFLSGI